MPKEQDGGMGMLPIRLTYEAHQLLGTDFLHPDETSSHRYFSLMVAAHLSFHLQRLGAHGREKRPRELGAHSH